MNQVKKAKFLKGKKRFQNLMLAAGMAGSFVSFAQSIGKTALATWMKGRKEWEIAILI